MSRVGLLALAALLACAHAYEDVSAAPQALELEEAASGDVTAILSCSFHGNPPPKITWRFQTGIADSTGRHWQTSDGSLVINPLHPSDSGIYTCEAENGFEVATQQVHLVINVYSGDVDCEQYEECEKLQHCDFGVEKTTDANGCERCQCKQNPCKTKSCAEGMRCVLRKTMPLNDQEPLFYAECKAMVKTGACPADETSPYNDTCPHECADDADCRGVGKCCRRGCSLLCLAPVTQTNITQITNYFLLRQIIFPAHGTYVPVPTIKPELPEMCKNTTGSLEINEDITTSEVTTDVIGTSEVGTDDIGTSEVATDVIGTSEVAIDVIGTSEVTTDVIGTSEVATDVIGTSEVATDVIGTSEVTTDVIGTSEVTTDVIGTSEVATDFIGTSEVTTDVIASSTLDTCSPCSDIQFGCCEDETKVSEPEETSITSEFTELTKETAAPFDKAGGNTNNEETTAVIGTSTLDLCSGFPFGCCADSETEASGPYRQGCPCNTTEFGCCSDGVTPASGFDNEGCLDPCSTTLHGCCQDGRTPAHGPEFEGCCLLQPFECCPDNRKPAEGPHLEGCGCQFALYGCCPDNVTIAQGPDNLGCGCQYTQHGCCLDRHTPASGPNNEGCACNTYQFGCCADGVTIAKGPDQQGCHCRDSKFGCCGDGETPAIGPDAAGCDCSSSQHGCCPDGRTEAAGPKFLGCTDAPENKQAVCSISTDPGPCHHNFTAMWYYDVAYGGCSRFWYGGCEGNGNRFATKADCEDVCVQPSPKDACKLPSVKGPCEGDYPRWHYNSTKEQCNSFFYGGCLGNANNFDTREHCQKQCDPSSVTGQCDLPIDRGSCAGNYSRWGFNPEAHRCEQFIWGGCEGNSNKFSSEAACQMRCTEKQRPQCTQPQEAGNCDEKEALWSFSQSENRCLPFYYSGCGGNDNRFGSREACEQTCPSAYLPDKCTLPAEIGQCSNYRERWFYDTIYKRCLQFYYGGCGGNENNFGTEAECENSCSEIKTTTTTTTTVRPAERLPQPQHPDKPISSVPEITDVPAAPIAMPQQEPKVAASEGGVATLRCLFHGNTPPKVTWKLGEHTIDSNAGRYRLTSDGALEIVSLYRNDTGVYICVADNGLGVATQEIHLVVNDPVTMPARIAEDENAVVTGKLGQPLLVRCPAYGYPQPAVFWYCGYDMVPYSSPFYESRGNDLLIKSLAIETLGEYTCQAYNGEGKAASWVVFVRAYMPEGVFIENELLVPRNTLPPRIRTQPPTSAETTTTTTSTTTEVPRPFFTVPVSAHVSTASSTLNIGADLRLACEIDGFPDPDVYWTKDGAYIQPDDRITITGNVIVSRLLVTRVTVADSGLYACHASNTYSSQSDTAQINIEKLTIPAKCIDNPFFANCDLIVPSKFCRHQYYGPYGYLTERFIYEFCCKSCVEAGQLDPQEAALQADQPLKKK